jgi:hypothetical protein
LIILIKVPLTFIAEFTGLATAWENYIIESAALEGKGRQQLELIYRSRERKEAKVKAEARAKLEALEAHRRKMRAIPRLVETLHGIKISNTRGDMV